MPADHLNIMLMMCSLGDVRDSFVVQVVLEWCCWWLHLKTVYCVQTETVHSVHSFIYMQMVYCLFSKNHEEDMNDSCTWVHVYVV